MRRFFGDGARRILGAVFLTIAVGMLVTGELFLQNVTAQQYLLFWSTCFLFTGLSLFVAFWDALAVMRAANNHQHRLFNSTVEEVERKTGQPLGVRYRQSDLGSIV